MSCRWIAAVVDKPGSCPSDESTCRKAALTSASNARERFSPADVRRRIVGADREDLGRIPQLAHLALEPGPDARRAEVDRRFSYIAIDSRTVNRARRGRSLGWYCRVTESRFSISHSSDPAGEISKLLITPFSRF